MDMYLHEQDDSKDEFWHVCVVIAPQKKFSTPKIDILKGLSFSINRCIQKNTSVHPIFFH